MKLLGRKFHNFFFHRMFSNLFTLCYVQRNVALVTQADSISMKVNKFYLLTIPKVIIKEPQ